MKPKRKLVNVDVAKEKVGECGCGQRESGSIRRYHPLKKQQHLPQVMD